MLSLIPEGYSTGNTEHQIQDYGTLILVYSFFAEWYVIKMQRTEKMGRSRKVERKLFSMLL